jgi:hypothetical protein
MKNAAILELQRRLVFQERRATDPGVVLVKKPAENAPSPEGQKTCAQELYQGTDSLAELPFVNWLDRR